MKPISFALHTGKGYDIWMGRVIYHYCSINTFDSIMRNKTIRLSDITKSNDSKEKQIIYHHLRDAINCSFKEMRLPAMANDLIGTEFTGDLSYYDFFYNTLHEFSNLCSLGACFSINGSTTVSNL